MGIKVKLSKNSEAELSRSIQKLADVCNESALDVMKSQGRLLCTDFAYWTNPRGKSPHDGRAHRDHIKRWIEFIYRTPQQAFNAIKFDANKGVAIAFLKHWKRRKYQECERLLNQHSSGGFRWRVGPFDGGTIHKQHAKSSRLHTVIVLTPGQRSARNAYIRKVTRRSGFAKSGFASAAADLGGTRGIPSWARKNTGPGSGKIVKGPKGVTLSIENRVRHIAPALDRNGERRAIQHRTKQMQKLTKTIGQRRMKRSSKSIK